MKEDNLCNHFYLSLTLLYVIKSPIFQVIRKPLRNYPTQPYIS